MLISHYNLDDKGIGQLKKRSNVIIIIVLIVLLVLVIGSIYKARQARIEAQKQKDFTEPGGKWTIINDENESTEETKESPDKNEGAP